MIRSMDDCTLLAVPNYLVGKVQLALQHAHDALTTMAQEQDSAAYLTDARVIWDLLRATGYTEGGADARNVP